MPPAAARGTASADPRNSSVLFIGDSHSCQTFGQTLDGLLRNYSPNVRAYAVADTSPRDWFTGAVKELGCRKHGPDPSVASLQSKGGCVTPKLPELDQELHDPEITVIALGTNIVAGVDGDPEDVKAQIRQVVEEEKKVHAANPSAACYWIGPPDFMRRGNHPFPRPEEAQATRRATAEFYGLLHQEVDGTCKVVDSRCCDGKVAEADWPYYHRCFTPGAEITYPATPVPKRPQPDGIHYWADPKVAEHWARCACSQMGLVQGCHPDL